MDQALVCCATTAKIAKGAIIAQITSERQKNIFFSFFFLTISVKQKKQGSSIPMDVEQIAPTKLKTTSMSLTPIPIPKITQQMEKVQIQKRRFIFFLFQAFSQFWIYELIIQPLCYPGLHLLVVGYGFWASRSCMRAMKLFLHPKNMMGKAKKTESRNPQLIMKKMAGLTVPQGSDLRKLASIPYVLPFIVCTKWQPMMPTSKYDPEQIRMPTSEAIPIFLSFAFLIPLKTGKKFIWKARARMRLGMEAMASNQSLGKRSIDGCDPTEESQSVRERKQWMTKAPTNTNMPVTPNKAMNLSLSIFLTIMEGIQQQPIMKTMKAGWVQNQPRAWLSGRTSSMILRMVLLKMMISIIQMPKLLKKISKDPMALENLL